MQVEYFSHQFCTFAVFRGTLRVEVFRSPRVFVYDRCMTMNDENQSRAEAERREKIRRAKSRRERVRRKKMQVSEKVGKSRNTVFFPMIWGSGGSKSRLAKAAGAEPSGQMRDEKLHAVVAWSTFRSQNVQSTPFFDHFWKLRCRKTYAVVARSTFQSQNAQSTPCPEHFGSWHVETVHAVVAQSKFRSQKC